MQITFNMDDNEGRGRNKIRSNTSCRQSASGRCAYSASWRQVHLNALHQVALVTQYPTDVCGRHAWRPVADYTWMGLYLYICYDT